MQSLSDWCNRTTFDNKNMKRGEPYIDVTLENMIKKFYPLFESGNDIEKPNRRPV